MPLRPLARKLLALALVAMPAMPALAAAQAPAPLVLAKPPTTATVLPIRDGSNEVRAFLLLEFPARTTSSLDRLLGRAPAGLAGGVTIPLAPSQRLIGQLSLDPQPALGVLCQGRGVIATLGSLAEHCLLSGLGSSNDPSTRLSLSRPSARGDVRLQNSQGQLTASLALNRYALGPSLSLPGTTASGLRLAGAPGLLGPTQVDERRLGLVGDLKLGSEGWLSIGGTWAHARLVSAAELPGALPSQWNHAGLSLGAGVGQFGGEVIGQRISLPGQTRNFSSVGVGMTWKTPWRAQLSVGAENLISRGKHPFTLPGNSGSRKDDEGRVPYVRYQQDL